MYYTKFRRHFADKSTTAPDAARDNNPNHVASPIGGQGFFVCGPRG